MDKKKAWKHIPRFLHFDLPVFIANFSLLWYYKENDTSVEDRNPILETVMAEDGGKLTVIARVACNNTHDSMELARHAESRRLLIAAFGREKGLPER